ncbi:SDR family oxidoreductase [Nocardia camponoti]|uniref:NAD(P)-dependent oxidoreductase n=1 Tax=Nocardia camponoti TaxID=1616106 RepID=A0A917Q8I0_9NOCA|nr:SDR family oxidoreductase [Nocardia camponoti]GGK35129.1 NAD(P)-dependent oxidoreductase [Nocardia camponoti]
MSETIAISGASGHIGGHVAKLLAGTGPHLRLLSRNPDHLVVLPDSTPARVDFADPNSVADALKGVQTFFFVSATESEHRAREQEAVVAAAKSVGVQRIVYLSFVGAAPDATFTFARDHYYTEQAIRAADVDFTFLRDNQYQDVIPHLADGDGVIAGPAADGLVAAVTRTDVADCAAAVLRTTDYSGETFDVTGPRAFTLETAAFELTQFFGRPFRYENQTVDEAYATRAKYNAPKWEVDGWVSTYTAIANGEMAQATDTVTRLTGHLATSFREYLASLPA